MTQRSSMSLERWHVNAQVTRKERRGTQLVLGFRKVSLLKRHLCLSTFCHCHKISKINNLKVEMFIFTSWLHKIQSMFAWLPAFRPVAAEYIVSRVHGKEPVILTAEEEVRRRGQRRGRRRRRERRGGGGNPSWPHPHDLTYFL